MDYEKEKMHPFFKLLIILFIIFIGFYIALQSGYYPTRIEKKTIITNKEIENFEDVLKSGEKVSVSGYLDDDVNYSNFVTKAGNGLTITMGKVIEEGIKGVSHAMKVLFW